MDETIQFLIRHGYALLLGSVLPFEAPTPLKSSATAVSAAAPPSAAEAAKAEREIV